MGRSHWAIDICLQLQRTFNENRRHRLSNQFEVFDVSRIAQLQQKLTALSEAVEDWRMWKERVIISDSKANGIKD